MRCLHSISRLEAIGLVFLIRAPFADVPRTPGTILIGVDDGGLDLCWLRTRRQWMGLKPKRASGDERIDTGLTPPCGFIAAAMNLAMMYPAQRHGELVANLASERAGRGESQMASVGAGHVAPVRLA